MILLIYSTFQTTFWNRTLAVLKKGKIKSGKKDSRLFPRGAVTANRTYHCYQPQKLGVITLGERNIYNTEKLLCYGDKEIIISP